MLEQNLSKIFDPKSLEQKWYKIWKEGGYFHPRESKNGQSFCIIMPPPNVTGQLHMGHALDATTQDALTRFKRMKGFKTLWLPGMDHAGIATQSVVEKKVFAQEGKTRHDFKREEFLEKIWEWKEEYGGVIRHQQESLGASPDWDYFMFTMDPEANQAVRKVFVELYNEGLIYQDNRLINWDTVLQSAISDAEVEYKEVQGSFYHIHYAVEGEKAKLEVATTRPETLFGDTAVAVNPDDERFKHLIGKFAIVPLCERKVPIIGDEHVDKEFGTGCLKVTPGHDFNDFEIGKRHGLEIVNILNLNGTLNNEAMEFSGLSCAEARKKIVSKLESLGHLVQVRPHTHQVGHGDRSKEVIEPLLSKQWFLNVAEMAKQSVECVEKEETKFYPKMWENTYFSWLREPKDWCLSRQLWWGHRIPVFTCAKCSHQWASESDPEQCPQCSHSEITQDPDVLDTWFSSGLWPFSTLGWPDKERMKQRDFDSFFPTSVLVTGYDIIFFWVARMMMMSLKFTHSIPFEKVYIHGLVRDKYGRKLSKSLGNGIDPIELIQEYGADAIRMTLSAGSGHNQNLNLDPARISGYRNFINKVWNAFRFVYPFLAEAKKTSIDYKSLDHQERWILSELNETTKIANEEIEHFRFDDATAAIYSFVYDKFCSWFIELSKNVLYSEQRDLKEKRIAVLRYVLRRTLALLHPYTPFITEELWSYLKDENEDLLIISPYPEYDPTLSFEQDRQQMNTFIETVTTIRNQRANVQIRPKELVNIFLFCHEEKTLKDLLKRKDEIQEMARVETLHLALLSKGKRPTGSVFQATSFGESYLPIEGKVDIVEQLDKLKKEKDKIQKDLEKIEKKLSNKNFTDRAPEEVILENRERCETFKNKLNSIEENIKRFSSI